MLKSRPSFTVIIWQLSTTVRTAMYAFLSIEYLFMQLSYDTIVYL